MNKNIFLSMMLCIAQNVGACWNCCTSADAAAIRPQLQVVQVAENQVVENQVVATFVLENQEPWDVDVPQTDASTGTARETEVIQVQAPSTTVHGSEMNNGPVTTSDEFEMVNVESNFVSPAECPEQVQVPGSISPFQLPISIHDLRAGRLVRTTRSRS